MLNSESQELVTAQTGWSKTPCGCDAEGVFDYLVTGAFGNNSYMPTTVASCGHLSRNDAEESHANAAKE
jgi:hypothetical protein